MKIYILTNAPFPYGMASIARLKCYAKAIQAVGLECEMNIFGRFPLYNKINKDKLKQDSENIPCRYASGKLGGSNNRIMSRFQSYCDKISILKYLKSSVKEGDIVLTYFSDLNFSKKVIEVTHKNGGFIVKELNELPGKGSDSQRMLRLKERTEKEVFSLYDGIICISDALLEYARGFASKKCKLLKIPILVDFEKYKLEDRQSESPVKYIFHSGSLIERKDGILGMIEAFGKATLKLKCQIHFYSTGTLKGNVLNKDIKKLIEQYHLEDKLFFIGYLNETELHNKLSMASLVIINKYKSIQNKYCFSTKLGEYMAAAKPVIITNEGEAMNWLKDNYSAYIIEAENNDALSDAIVQAFLNEPKRVEIGKNGRIVCKESFCYTNYSKVLLDYFETLHITK